MGATFSVTGKVVDVSGNPIVGARIRAYNHGSFEKPAFNTVAKSDENGYFETEGVFSYGCTPFEVRVTAKGYERQALTFYPPAGEGWPDELPPSLTITLEETQ